MIETTTVGPASAHAFDPALSRSALSRAATHLELTDGRRIRLPVRRWHATAAGSDHWMLDRCAGPTLDLGCGPGRFVAGLHAAGVPALGVDYSRQAVHLTRRRGAPAVHRDLFARLPAEGRWSHILLADGNIGIGGDPLTLLRRTVALLAPGGSVLVETASPADGLWRGSARLHGPARNAGSWFPWSTVGLAAVPGLARAAGLCAVEAVTHGLGSNERSFARLIQQQSDRGCHG